jgi:hypothetical protein
MELIRSMKFDEYYYIGEGKKKKHNKTKGTEHN